MSPVFEFVSKSVEKAIKKASQKLKIPPEKLEYDVISYGSTGIFGLVGSKKAKIRIVLPEESKGKAETKKPKEMERSRDSVDAIVKAAFGESDLSESFDGAVQIGKEVLQKLIDFITTDASIEVKNNKDKICYDISGGNTAILIGKRGQTLEAMQYLVEKIVNRNSEKKIRIEVDIEGYLDSRKERLENLALRLGEKVKKTGRPMSAGQLNAHDRRIVHITLKNDQYVRTQSIGEGYYRKLKIYPKKKNRKT